MVTKHPALLIVAVLAAVLVISVTAYPARTAPKSLVVTWQTSQPESLQSAGVHKMVGAHAFHASF